MRLGLRVVVERHLLVEDREVAGLLEVRGDAEDEPERIVVEAAADVVVAALGERLVLVVGAAVGELRRGDVEDPLAGARRAPGARSPSRSWFESRKPMPRPMPVSKYEALRDMLNVTMHW